MWLSTAPLKPTTISTMVESPQFGAQEATGSSIKAHDQGSSVLTKAVYFINKVPTLGFSLAVWPNQVFATEPE